jgi:hypothetical protein
MYLGFKLLIVIRHFVFCYRNTSKNGLGGPYKREAYTCPDVTILCWGVYKSLDYNIKIDHEDVAYAAADWIRFSPDYCSGDVVFMEQY